MSEIEIRHWDDRAAVPTVKDGNQLSGRAAPFNSPTMIGKAPWGFREQIKPGAFKNTTADGEQVLLDNHQDEKPIARTSAKTLQLHEGRKGWDWTATPANTTYANDVVENVRAGNYGGCSFSFEVVSDKWDYDTDDGIPLRTLLEVNAREISIVTFPAYKDTDVSARSQAESGWEAFERWYERELLNDGKYPIDTKANARATWTYLNRSKSVPLIEARAETRAACRKFGIDLPDDNGKTVEIVTVELREGLTLHFDAGLWPEEARGKYLNEEKWIELPGDDPEGEPSRLTREEVEKFSEHMTNVRREQYRLRKEQFRKDKGK